MFLLLIAGNGKNYYIDNLLSAEMATVNFTLKEYGRRFRKALSVPFLIDQACSPAIQDFVKVYSNSIGCNEKCIFFPLLSCCAACMGTNAQVELTANWQEPVILWTLIITPMILHRIDVAEHMKQQMLLAQEELSNVKNEDDSQVIRKFVVDDINGDNLQEILRINDGQAFGIYNSTRSLHNVLSTSHDVDIMHKLHSGSSWFSNSRMTKKLLQRTQMNVSILSSPSSVYDSLTTAPNFQELYHDCFLTVCAEENYVKFSQLQSASSCESLQRMFKDIITLHSSMDIKYKLSEEASTKFSQIHDEITDKAKQLARKNSSKVFYPALSYLARISCVLHVIDNALEAVNFTVPVNTLTWNTEISIDTVWRARQVLGYVIEQKFALSQSTVVEASPVGAKRVESVTIIDGPVNRMSNVRNNVYTPQRIARSNINMQRGGYSSPQRPHPYLNNSSRGRPIGSLPRHVQNTSSNATFDLLLGSSNSSGLSVNNMNSENTRTEPMISAVSSAGVPVPVDDAVTTPTIQSVTSLNDSTSSMMSVNSTGVNLNNSRNMNNSSLTPQSIALMSEDEFVSSFKVQIRRFLIHSLKDISLALSVDLELAPKPVSGFQSTEQKTAMARIFLKRLETLGFGSFNGSNSIPRTWVFKKRPYNTLSDKQLQILTNIRVNEREYDKCFQDKGDGIVCLE